MPWLQLYGRALVVLPYVSIVTEKTEHLASLLKPMQVCGLHGGLPLVAHAWRTAGIAGLFLVVGLMALLGIRLSGNIYC